MRTRLCLLLVVGLLVAADEPKGDAKGDQAKIEGMWVCVSAERGGKPLPDEQKSFKFTFKGNKMTVELPDGQKHEGTFKLDSSKKPKHMTIKPSDEDKELQAIYEFDGDKLKLCGGEPGGERPKEFATKEGDRQMLFVLKRVKS
jgi:uncharacterized protein (TIGR03067 family)